MLINKMERVSKFGVMVAIITEISETESRKKTAFTSGPMAVNTQDSGPRMK